ncbi:radical SAM protein [Halarcobacter mediterraneus]|uniref:Radical SAM protein n=1 Tax=Halarcobacter mediterraneus TaxID=2023153 RepID=A0A4Q1AT67_9BACT|nr:radical SAM protein [Halarcobacter mediterraneus]RXK12318.1 radical SAM protein [Halarcobacter mediterraneus]
MSYSNNIIFGPIPSRRFGISLGIDLSPSSKQCNFDCLYCELEKAKTVETMTKYPSVEEVINEVKASFKKHPKIDVITITANGEPTLYPHLDKLIDELNKIKKNAKTLILSNGSTIYDEKVYKALLKIDTVKLSLDCVSEKCFKKLDRVHSGIDIDKIIESMIKFRKETTNILVLEVLFVKTLNDKEEEIKALYEAIKKINPHRVDIGTIDRPPAYKVKPVSFETLQSIAETFEGINVNIAYKNRPKLESSFSEEEIKTMLKRRPLTQEDINNMFDEDSKKLLEILVSQKVVSLVDSSGLNFYKIL